MSVMPKRPYGNALPPVPRGGESWDDFQSRWTKWAAERGLPTSAPTWWGRSGRRWRLDLRPIAAEANARLLMTYVGQWLEREWPWLFEGAVDGDDCCVCQWPLGGSYVGAGDGSGRKFTHRECVPPRDCKQVVES